MPIVHFNIYSLLIKFLSYLYPMPKALNIENKLAEKLALRKQANSLRVLPRFKDHIDFCSNDYLGFARTLSVQNPTTHGATGSRLISGNSNQFEELEAKIAAFHKAKSALIYNSGYDANLGLFSCIGERGDTIIYDQYIHASIRDGIRLSKARSFAFEHNNLSSLEKKLQQASGNVLVAIESIYSMDGDRAPLKKIIDLCEKYKAELILDEAHATGIIGENGEGLAQSLKLEVKLFARIHTFGKAMGCHGAVILGSETFKQYLINFSRPFIYTTALSQHNLNAITSSYIKLENSSLERSLLEGNINLFQSLLSDKLKSKWIPSKSPIQCILVKGNSNVKELEEKLQKRGFNIRAILHPTVEEGKERIRICLHSYNTKEQIIACVKNLEELIK